MTKDYEKWAISKSTGIKKIISTGCLLYLTFLASLQSVYADNPPNRVYYMNQSHYPQYYFDNGIAPAGGDYNLLNLISGSSADTTGYVATITNLPLILHSAEQILAEHSWTYFWVYTIRPTNNFYNVLNSLHMSALNAQYNGNIDLFNRLQLLEAQQREDDFETWVSSGTLPREQIESATLYRLINNRLIEYATLANPNYVSAEPMVNTGAIIMATESDEYIYYDEIGLFHMLPGPLCDSFSPGAALLTDNSDQGVCTQHTYQDLQLKLRQNIILISG